MIRYKQNCFKNFEIFRIICLSCINCYNALQVSKLTALGIHAEQLAGDDTGRHTRVLAGLRGDTSSLPSLLYLTPERLAASRATQDCLMKLHNRKLLNRYRLHL